MSYETILFEIRKNIALITLNRPEVLNGLNEQMIVDIRDALNESDGNPEVKAVIITGSGKAFCSGADLSQAGDQSSPDTVQLSPGDYIANFMYEQTNPLILEITRHRKPIIGAVNGTVAGGGVGLALAPDIVIASRSASFVQVFGPQLGIVPDMGTTWFLPRLIGHARSMALALTGEKLSAEKAAEWGLIWKCIDDDKLMNECFKVAEKLAGGPPLVYPYMKRVFSQSQKNSLQEQLDLETESQRVLCSTEDFMEGAIAFMGKRKPNFKGK